MYTTEQQPQGTPICNKIFEITDAVNPIEEHLETIARASKRPHEGQEGHGIKKSKNEDEEESKRVYTINKKSSRKNPYFKWEENVYALDLHANENKTFDEAINDMKFMFEQLYIDFVKNVAAQESAK